MRAPAMPRVSERAHPSRTRHRPLEEPQSLSCSRRLGAVSARQCFDAAADRRKSGDHDTDRSLALDVRPHHRRRKSLWPMLAPWVGYHSEKRGRKPLLLIGFALSNRSAPRCSPSPMTTLFSSSRSYVDGMTGADHRRVDDHRHHRPDQGHRTIQPRARRRRRGERHRRVGEHIGDRFPVSRNWSRRRLHRHRRRRGRRGGP